MAWFDSRTVFVSISLFCLPLLVLCAVLCLPLLVFTIVTLYVCAWAAYLLMAQTDTEFNLPYNPSRVLTVNIVMLQHILSWLSDLPLVIAYLRWRYWQVGTEKFRRIVRRDVRYSNECTLDVYLPDKRGKLAPIIVFIYGGSWSSGIKWMYTPFANTLRELGYVVVVPDYRKYPLVKADGMYDDVRCAIKWAFKHAKEIQGDPEMVYVMGHSAGAQLASQVVLSDAIQQAKYAERLCPTKTSETTVSEKHDPSLFDMAAETRRTSDLLPLVEGLLLFAGVYSIEQHYAHETSRGVEKISAMGRVMGGSAEGFRANSPIELVKRHDDLFAISEAILDHLPRILFVHGEKDTTVPKEQSAEMYRALGEVLPLDRHDEVDVHMRLYKRMNHGQCITALMPSIFGKARLKQALTQDIQDFIDIPSE